MGIKKKLLFGEYLVSKGAISQKDVAKICNIQLKSVKPVGKLAVDNKFLSLADIFTIRSHQRSTGQKFGEVAINLNFLKPRQVQSLLQLQKDLKPFFGELLVSNAILSEEEFLKELKAFQESQDFLKTRTNRKIVIVDMDRENLSELKDSFNRLGHEVIAMDFAPDEFRSLMEKWPDFVILNLSKRKDEIFKVLRQARKDLPVEEFRILALMDKLTPADKHNAANAGIVEFAPANALPANIVQYAKGIFESLEMELAGKVLMVDDSQTVLRLMSFFLENEGYETYMASSGEEALAMLEKISPDLVLTDLHMPGINGIELCRRIKLTPKTRNVPVVMVTTAKAISRLNEALDSGANDYMVKPFQRDELLARVRSHIKTKRLIDELQTSRRKLLVSNEKLADANNKKTEFLSTVAHDLRTPLTSIRTYSELMGMQNVPIETQKDFVEIIKSEAIRMSGLIRNYLDISRMESGAAIYRKQEVDLAEMVNYFSRIYSKMSQNKNVDFTSTVPRHPVLLMGDKGRLEQVLANLLDNAVKFTPAGGTITLKLAVASNKAKKFAEICVSDTGQGILPEAQQFIFKKFHQMYNKFQSIEGAGLGLAICKEIVDGHGGKIELQSEYGHGATFRVLMPMAGTGDEVKKRKRPG